MPQQQHGFGMIGCGMIAEFHTRAVAEIPGAAVVAVFDTVPEKARKIADLAGGDCRVYDSLDAMLADPRVTVASVCTPSGAHMDPAVAAARAGKHVVCEKPLEITLPRCDAIIQACESNGVRLCAIFPSRFSAANIRLKEAIDAGRFGKLTLGDTYIKWWRSQEYYDSGGWRGTWELDGGGALMNQSIHNVDLIQWLMGDVVSVQALTATLCHERIEVEDTAVAILRFKNGALGVIEAATSCYPGLLKRTEIHGEAGSARVDQDDVTLWEFRDKAPGDDAVIGQGNATTGGAGDPRAISHAGHREQLADFLAAIDSGGAPRVDGREGRKAVELIRAIYRSARLNAPVALPLTDDVPLGPA
jgi:predicted dehydrogenase